MIPVVMAAFAAASLAVSLMNNRSQGKIEKSNIKMQVEQTRVQAAEMAYERARTFRKSVSSQLALSAMGVGGATGFRGAYNESLANYAQDIESLERKAQFAQVTGMANQNLSSAKRMANDMQSVTNAANLASDLGLFKSKNPAPVKRSGF